MATVFPACLMRNPYERSRERTLNQRVERAEASCVRDWAGAMVVIGVTAIGWGLALSEGSYDEPIGRLFAAAGVLNTVAIGWCWWRPQNAAWWIRWFVQPAFTLTLTIFGYFFADVLHGTASDRLENQFGITGAALVTIAVARVVLATAVHDLDKKREEKVAVRLRSLDSSQRKQATELEGVKTQLRKLRQGQHQYEVSGKASILRAIAERLFGPPVPR